MRTPAVVIGLGLVLAAGCGRQSGTTPQELAAGAQQEYDVLASSLQEAAEGMLEEIRQVTGEELAEPFSYWNVYDEKELPFATAADNAEAGGKEAGDSAGEKAEKADPATDPGEIAEEEGVIDEEAMERDVFQSPDGKRWKLVWLPAEKKYVLHARHTTYRYKLKGVRKIVRTGRRDDPFEGTVDVEVTTVERHVARQRRLPAPIPDGYRRLKEGELPNSRLQRPLQIVMEPAEIVMLAFAYDCPDYPLPYSPTYESVGDPDAREDLPAELKPLLQELVRACPDSEPTETTETHTVTFRYWAAGDKWDWRTDAQRTAEKK